MSLNDYMKSAVAKELTAFNTEQTKGITIEKTNASNARIAGIDAQKRAKELGEQVEDTQIFYEMLLCKPMHEIAAINSNFKETYEAQQLIMAEWMVSQKAFKELAIQFGKEKGLTPQEVKKMGLDKEIDVLEDKHDPEHGTIVGDSVIIGPRVEELKKRFYASKNK